MSPFINESNIILVSFLPYLFKRPQINDIIILKHPDKNIKIIKRIRKIHNNKYFVIGDNIRKSTDSRVFGPIDKSLILSKVLFK